jgi:hypothetical protein
MKSTTLLIGMIWVLSALSSCKNESGEGAGLTGSDPVLAEFKEKKLTYGMVASSLPAFTDAADSLRHLNFVAENWLKEQSFLDLARSEIVNNAEIDALVEDYRTSLILDEYEEKILSTSLDSNVSENELLQYYDQKKGEYKLEDPILRLLYVKIPKAGFDSKVFGQLWEKAEGSKAQEMLKYCQNNADQFLLQPAKWYKWKEVSDILPSRFVSLSTMFSGMQREFADFKYHYFIKVKEIVRPNERPPISFFSLQAKKSILHERSKKILEKARQTQYEKKLGAKDARIMVR